MRWIRQPRASKSMERAYCLSEYFRHQSDLGLAVCPTQLSKPSPEITSVFRLSAPIALSDLSTAVFRSEDVSAQTSVVTIARAAISAAASIHFLSMCSFSRSDSIQESGLHSSS